LAKLKGEQKANIVSVTTTCPFADGVT